jgi:hypothetical protein
VVVNKLIIEIENVDLNIDGKKLNEIFENK